MTINISVFKGSRNTASGNNGILKEVNGVNGIPISIAPGFPDLEDQFNQMGITHVRLHDCFGVGDIDNYFQPNRRNNQDQLIPNIPTTSRTKAKQFIADFANKRTIFPYAAAGMRANNVDLAFKDANYQMTDDYLKRIMSNNPSVNPGNIQRKVMFRIGRTLDGGYEIPQNFDIYATLISTLVNRYSLNYQATGLPRKIEYWEIWNEPDLTFFWNNNNPQIYYEFYSKIARMIKAVDPEAKVGGCGVANGYNPGGAYLDGLLNYCRSTNTPIDFLSWHYYGNLTSDPQNIIDIGNSIQSTLTRYGYGNIESLCTEWNSSPFGTVNTFTKVQSAKNAAYIASTLIYMQYCKTDKAYYYRGDGSSFGLFNDNPNPTNTSSKSFCTYSAQSFNLFTRIFETPFILTQNNSFNTGMTTLAAENAEGNKINILAANYKVDRNFSNGNIPPTETRLYKQYYLDSGRTINQITDQWSIDHWFGGVNPSSIITDNSVTQKNVVSQLPVNGRLTSRARNYNQSDSGLTLTINNIETKFRGYKITAYRIKEGGPLDKIEPQNVSDSVITNMTNGVLSIQDNSATPSTVTLYSIEFTNDQNGNTGGNTGGGSITYTVPIQAGIRTPLSMVLPTNYNFIANKQYRLTISRGLYYCPGSTTLNPQTNSCTTGGTAMYSYTNSIFTPFISGLLWGMISGSAYVYLPSGGNITCALTPV
ncbi:Beta-xylosidase (XynB) (PDB:1PX8) [Commensalibacter communis]|uniref:GH39 family glycosyl hydrolase n=1 Tax=Commensalibacter communis TaxID=2972786 RepID=UPI0022FFB956|nr:glycoside hydrolase family 39 [Commensalibacter communis]CAI3959681.1 Beta-xylosidase (XynB) (PDB:1PX8) [Commensalibacter communis]